ncbi:VOC family protein [Streptomyces roseicoloratus]|uniref:VOC family protein n=1 Tax=Streptomyces roseicoloratus TaxID=2508722 RepID=A0ABY9RRQ7_9ACTN|nr:VOC family protein [Streptomyces roseicoloratus]WMX44398.1 VOC family protein [Streptomyces roseicoloratus]
MDTHHATPSPVPAPSAAPRLDVVGLVTADMAASLAFYRLLGLDLPPGAEDAPHVEVALPGGLRVMWDSEDVVRSYDPAWTRPAAGGARVALAFRCADPGRVDAVYEALTAAGHRGHLKPWDAVWGQRYAVVLDPDGTGVSLYADTDTDAETETDADTDAYADAGSEPASEPGRAEA